MALYLVQHGQSLPKDVDPDQGLSEKGVAETERIAEVAKNYHINVGQILHSVKTRARKTADILASALNPTESVKEVEGLKPMDDVAAFWSPGPLINRCLNFKTAALYVWTKTLKPVRG